MERAAEIKRTKIFVFMMVVIFMFGMFCTQALFWYKTGSSGRTWVEHQGYTNEVTYVRTQGSFPFTDLKSSDPDACECGVYK